MSPAIASLADLGKPAAPPPVSRNALVRLNATIPAIGSDRSEWVRWAEGMGLKRIEGSTGIYGGTCPLCGTPKSFYVFVDAYKGRKHIVCFDGCKHELTVAAPPVPPKPKIDLGDEAWF